MLPLLFLLLLAGCCHAQQQLQQWLPLNLSVGYAADPSGSASGAAEKETQREKEQRVR